VHGALRLDWASVHRRARALAAGLRRLGVGYGEVVSVLSPNTPAMIEAHFGVPGAGAVLNTINFRLDPPTIAYILGHAETRVLGRHSPLHVPACRHLEMEPHLLVHLLFRSCAGEPLAGGRDDAGKPLRSHRHSPVVRNTRFTPRDKRSHCARSSRNASRPAAVSS